MNRLSNHIFVIKDLSFKQCVLVFHYIKSPELNMFLFHICAISYEVFLFVNLIILVSSCLVNVLTGRCAQCPKVNKLFANQRIMSSQARIVQDKSLLLSFLHYTCNRIRFKTFTSYVSTFFVSRFIPVFLLLDSLLCLGEIMLKHLFTFDHQS